MKLPVDFEQRVKVAASPTGAGSPVQISASDLMRNFNYAALDAEDGWIENSASGSHPGRKLTLPAIPGSGTYVLGCVGGRLQWLETSECESGPPP